MPKYNGPAEIKCDNCSGISEIDGSDFDLEEVEGVEREMGRETTYSATIEIQCNQCGKEIEIESKVWEYPPGAYNLHETRVHGGVLTQEFPQPDFV